MQNFRLRMQLIMAANILLILPPLAIINWVTKSELSFFEIAGFVVMAVLLLVFLVDGILSSYYLGKITNSGINMDGKSFMALRDASVPRLRYISMQLGQKIEKLNGQIEALLLSAKPYPDLASSQEFQKAVYGFKFEKAKKMVVLAERSARYTVDEALRKEQREQSKMGKLIADALALGLSEQDAKNMSLPQLRDAVFMEREWQSVLATASGLRCRDVVEKFGRHDWANVTLFLVRAQKFANESRGYGIEAKVGDFISCGDLNAAEKLILARKQEIEFFAMKDQLQNRINSLPEQYRPPRQALFESLCAETEGTRYFYIALHNLEKSLKECGA